MKACWLRTLALLVLYFCGNIGVAISHVPIEVRVVHSHVHSSDHHAAQEQNSRERQVPHEHSHEVLSSDCNSCSVEMPEIAGRPDIDHGVLERLTLKSPTLRKTFSELFRPPIG